MKPYIARRTLECAHYIVNHHSTVRDTARHFGLGKSTVHTYLTVNLPKLDPQLSKKVEALFCLNQRERHIRGGQSTRLKYAHSSSKV